MQGRRIKQTYGTKCQIWDVLDNLPKLINLFKYKYENEVLKKIMNYLKQVKNEMFEEMTQGYKPEQVVGKYISVLVDVKQVEMMLKRYMQFKGYPNQSVEHGKKICKNFNIPTGCIKELKQMLIEE